MKLLITGAGGQVADALVRLAPAAAQVSALGHAGLDISDGAAVEHVVASYRPHVIINAAAYTAVDKAESEPELAQRVNGAGPGHLAAAAARHSARLLHISTDFVFDGTATQPYVPDAPTAPLGIYGASKLEGERRALEVSGGQALVLRTAWVYAAKGHNFVRTMLRLMGERDTLKVVRDQVGSPTWASSVAEALWAAVRTPGFRGIHHWTDAGATSWFDFAVAISAEARAMGLLQREVQVLPITTSEYPTPARRPAYSVLDCRSSEASLGIRTAPWRENLKKMLMELNDA